MIKLFLEPLHERRKKIEVNAIDGGEILMQCISEMQRNMETGPPATKNADAPECGEDLPSSCMNPRVHLLRGKEDASVSRTKVIDCFIAAQSGKLNHRTSRGAGNWEGRNSRPEIARDRHHEKKERDADEAEEKESDERNTLSVIVAH